MQPHQFRPRNDNVLVRLIPEPEQLAPGLVRPQNLKENVTGTLRGVVIASGPGHNPSRNPNAVTRPTGVGEGDLVLLRGLAGQRADQWDSMFDRHIDRQNAGSSEVVDSEDYRVVRADEILAVVEGVTEAEFAATPTMVHDYTLD